MDELPLDVCRIIDQYKLDMELLTATPNMQRYISTVLAEERNIIGKICALSYGSLPTILRAKDILEASVDLIDFYRDAETNWNKRHDVWGLTPIQNPPSCSNNIGYLVYQWLCLEGQQANMDCLVATGFLNKYTLW